MKKAPALLVAAVLASAPMRQSASPLVSNDMLNQLKSEDFEALREQRGYEVSDNLVCIVADLLRQTHAGLEADGDIGKILSGLDYCLSQAGNRGPFSIERQLSTNLDPPQGKMQWRGWLEDAIESRRLFLVGQQALDKAQVPVQRELFIRARDAKDRVIPASAFMPMAASLGMALDIDREVFRMVAENRALASDVPLALNLSAALFERAEALEDFEQLLAACDESGTRLCIEASHLVLNEHPPMCRKISERAHRHRHQFGIDNLDLGLPLQLLQSGQFDHVKINAGTLHGMGDDDMAGGYRALRTITDTLDIRIIAVAVDSQEVRDELYALRIDTMQGNLSGTPEAV